MEIDITTLLIATISSISALGSGVISFVGLRDRKRIRALIALVNISNIKTEMNIDVMVQTSIGKEYKTIHEWEYKQKEGTIKEYERQFASIGMDV